MDEQCVAVKIDFANLEELQKLLNETKELAEKEQALNLTSYDFKDIKAILKDLAINHPGVDLIGKINEVMAAYSVINEVFEN